MLSVRTPRFRRFRSCLPPDNVPEKPNTAFCGPAVSTEILILMPYLWVFLAALAVDLVPVFGPPAWTVMVLLQVKFDLNPWLVLAVGVPGSVLGRYVLSLYSPWLSKKVIKRRKTDELEFVGRKLTQKRWQSWTFVFLYSVSPLPTTPLFSAAGLAKIGPLQIIPPFFVGKLISDAVMLLAGRTAFMSGADLLMGTF